MERFLKALLDALPSWARPLASPIISRILAVWRWAEGLSRRLKGGFGTIVTGALRLRDGIKRAIVEAFTTLKWLVLIYVPKWAQNALTSAVKWAATNIGRAQRLLAQATDTLRRWAAARLADVFKSLTGLRRWVTDLLRPVNEAMSRLRERVFGAWATPARLARWLVAAMWSALWSYAYDNLDRLASALWRARKTLLLRTVVEVERIVGRLL